MFISQCYENKHLQIFEIALFLKFPAYLVTLTEEIYNGKFHFCCSDVPGSNLSNLSTLFVVTTSCNVSKIINPPPLPIPRLKIITSHRN